MPSGLLMKRILCILLFGCWRLLPAQVPESIPKNGLQGYWPFNGDASDASGYNWHGLTHGNIKLEADRFGKPNSAYFFNGISDYITTNYEGILGSHPRAVSFWAVVRHNGRGMPGILWGDDGQFPNAGGRFNCCFGSCYTCETEKQGDLIGATIDCSDAGVTFEGQEPVTDGQWHHYVFQFDGKYVRDVVVYQDGLLLTHEPYRFYKNCLVNTRPNTKVMFGALFADSTPLYYKGLMDDIAIYDRVLSTQEIKQIYLAPDPNAKTNYLKWLPAFLGIVLLTLLVVGFIRLRVKKLVTREKEKIQVEKKWYEQENRVLKAQMDPHFVFNSLNTIQQFIIVNENEKAQLYLSKFSRLIRKLLESNLNESISLQEEIDMYEKYLEIESMRFNNIFDYEIIVDKSIDVATTYIPHFLIQPFIENAIRHGLLPKLGYKELDIVFTRENEKTLLCTVEDNGIGRKNSAPGEYPGKTKSLGVTFVQQRLLLMSKMDKREYNVTIIDKEDEQGNGKGTKVIIKLPIITK
jgi:two-component sensor histidine kinase